MPDVITANRLTDGVVLFRTADENWTEDFNRAAVQADPEATARALARAKEDEASNLVVDAYAVPVEQRNGHVAPRALREAIRAAGPTTRRDLGKQAAGLAPLSGPGPWRRPTMYHYDNFDAAFVAGRVEQFRDQVARRLSGELTEEQFRPHRLMNGLYLQLHSYMLRVAVPYGVLNSRQMRKLAEIARRYDRGYGHFTTRQNIQYNWPALKDTPDILAELASVEMHAIQTLRKLHSQHHRRPLLRRRARRNRRPAPLCRDPEAVVVAPSRIFVSAAQVQDRGQWRDP